MRFSLALPLLLASCVSAAADVVPTETDLIMAAQKGDPKIDDGTLPLDNFPEKAAAAVFKKFPSRNVVVTSLSYTLSGKAVGPPLCSTSRSVWAERERERDAEIESSLTRWFARARVGRR